MHPIVADVVLRLRFVVQRADLHPAGAEVGDQALFDDDLAAALAEREAVTADVGELAADEGDLVGVLQGDDAIDRADGGLIGHRRRQGGEPLRMAEAKSAEGEMGDRLPGFSGEGEQFLGDRIGPAGGFDGFADARQVGEFSCATEEPFAWFVQQGWQVFDDHAGEMVEGRVGLLGRAADLERAG